MGQYSQAKPGYFLCKHPARLDWHLRRDGIALEPGRRWGKDKVMHDINRPEIVAEVTEAFQRYEAALQANDVAVLNASFWHAPQTLRFGTAENLYGYEAIAAFRSARVPTGTRTLSRTVITSYGDDFATANTEFQRPGDTRIGRQSQTWFRLPVGWCIVAAHVSFMEVKPD